MLLLTSVADKIQLITSAAGAVDAQVSWVDKDGTTITPGRTNSAIVTAATTDVSGSPAASQQRNVQTLLARNIHATDPNTVTVRHTDGATPVQLFKVELLAGESLQYVDGDGFSVFDRWGSRKSTASMGDYDSGYVVLSDTEAQLTDNPTKVAAIMLVNLTNQVQRVTVKDDAASPNAYLKTFKLEPAETKVIPFYGMMFESGIRWFASTAASVGGQVIGFQNV